MVGFPSTVLSKRDTRMRRFSCTTQYYGSSSDVNFEQVMLGREYLLRYLHDSIYKQRGAHELPLHFKYLILLRDGACKYGFVV